jgi:hypothetical protein
MTALALVPGWHPLAGIMRISLNPGPDELTLL